ncbi:glycosyltransferase involved in cell wall biosynthesis [Salinibacter ruber]|nr:glycosyltransferase involved in cell wall biosynthesis [Salinibacter ruber]
MVSKERTVVTPGSGVDPDGFAYEEEPVSEGDLIVMLPTRMLWHKGGGTFVEAAEQLQHAGLSARFVLVGDTDPGNPGAVPEEQIREWESAGIIEWWGPQESDEMPDVLRQAHVVCLPSYYREGIPKVLIEAASCGRPIVTTDVPGCREIVADGENGMLVPTKDGGHWLTRSAPFWKIKKCDERWGERADVAWSSTLLRSGWQIRSLGRMIAF